MIWIKCYFSRRAISSSLSSLVTSINTCLPLSAHVLRIPQGIYCIQNTSSGKQPSFPQTTYRSGVCTRPNIWHAQCSCWSLSVDTGAHWTLRPWMGMFLHSLIVCFLTRWNNQLLTWCMQKTRDEECDEMFIRVASYVRLAAKGLFCTSAAREVIDDGECST